MLLGAFNGQGTEYEELMQRPVVLDHDKSSESHLFGSVAADSNPMKILMRVTPNVEYIKLVLLDGRLIGALLVGETDLEETFENLILNQLDIGAINIDLLDPEVDLEDFFD